MKEIIYTENAPQAIGTYSQAVKVANTVYLSGQIPLDKDSMTLVSTDFSKQLIQVFHNLNAVCEASGGSLSEIIKLNVYLVDLNQFPLVNEVMETFFTAPYPARAAIEVSALPKGALVEVDGVMVL